MPKNKKNKNNTTAKIIGIILLVLLAFAGGFFIAQRFTGGNTNNNNPENDQEKTNKPVVIENSEPLVDKPDEVEEKDKTPVKYDGEDPNNLDTLTGSVTYSGVAGDKLIIRVSIDQYLGNGTCSLSLANYSEMVNISASASTSTCEGFDIPLANLEGLSGDVNFVINLVSGDKTGTITGEANL